jgi:hypothetical protein
VRHPRQDWRPGWVQPHVDGASLGVVERRPGGAAPALAGSLCSGAAGVTAISTVAAVTMTTATATMTTATTNAGGGGGVWGRGPLKGVGEDGGRYCWIGVGEGHCCYSPEAVRAMVEPEEASTSRVSSSRRRSLWTSW